MPNTVNPNVKKPNLQVHKDTKFGTLEAKVNPALKTNVEESKPELVNWVDDALDFIAKLIAPFSPFSLMDVSIKRCGPDNENVLVTRGNGDKCYFIPDGNSFKLSHIILSDGTTIHCDLSDSEKAKYNDSRINDDVDIRGYTTIEVNGHSTKVFWVGDETTDLDAFKKHLNNIKQGLDEIPSNVLKKVIDDGNFNGFYICDSKSASSSGGGWSGFYDQDTNAIYIDSSFSLLYSDADYETVIHEFGHAFDFALGNGESKASADFNDDNIIAKNWEDNGDIMKELIPTSSGYHTNGPTNLWEFFACAFQIYVKYPDELEELLPDVYEYIKDIVVNA